MSERRFSSDRVDGIKQRVTNTAAALLGAFTLIYVADSVCLHNSEKEDRKKESLIEKRLKNLPSDAWGMEVYGHRTYWEGERK